MSTPPAKVTPAGAGPAVHTRTKFVSNAAHDASTEAKTGGMVAGAAAAVTAVAAAAVAAVRKVGKHDEPTPAPDGVPEPVAEVPSPSAKTPPADGVRADAPVTPEAPPPGGAWAAVPVTPGTQLPGSARADAPVTPKTPPARGAWADRPVTPEPDEHAGDLLTAYPSARPGPAGAIHGVGITILVSDLDRSIAFYRDTLGFFEIDRGEGSAVLASGDTRLVLRTVPGRSTEAGTQIYLNLEVGDVEAIYRELLAKDVPFVHPPRAVDRGDRLELWSATFRDPDDHTVAITQWRAIR